MIDQPQPPVPSENDYGARPTVPDDLNSEDFDQYDGEVREPEAKPNGGTTELGEYPESTIQRCEPGLGSHPDVGPELLA